MINMATRIINSAFAYIKIDLKRIVMTVKTSSQFFNGIICKFAGVIVYTNIHLQYVSFEIMAP